MMFHLQVGGRSPLDKPLLEYNMGPLASYVIVGHAIQEVGRWSFFREQIVYCLLPLLSGPNACICSMTAPERLHCGLQDHALILVHAA